MMANLICQLNELRDAQIVGKTLFVSMSVRVFLGEISIWIRLSKDPPSPTWVGITQYIGGPKKTKKAEEEWILSLFLSWAIFSCPWASELLVLGPSESKTYTRANHSSILRPLTSDWELHYQLPWFSQDFGLELTVPLAFLDEPIPVTNLL